LQSPGEDRLASLQPAPAEHQMGSESTCAVQQQSVAKANRVSAYFGGQIAG